jgi:cyclophilin family peptidyl-prolyl cis-trans isomerase
MLRETHESQQSAAVRPAAIEFAASARRLRGIVNGGSMLTLSRISTAACAGLLLGLLLAQGTATAEEPNPQVRVTTSMGEFVIELRPDRAPITVANFLRYVKEGHYTNTLFHRVIANFVIQGGGHDATSLKLKPTHESVFNESGNGLQNKRGTVGLARSDAPHSGNAQVYVNLVDNPDLDPVPTRWGYTVFGRVVQGMDVIDRIGETPTGASGPFKSDAPLKPVIIEKIEVVGAGAAVTAPVTPVTPPPQNTILSPK